MTDTVAVLGCGPAGIFAAHAAAEAGAAVTIYSKPRKSIMRGAQYLHRPIPGLSIDPFEVDYRLVGTADGYRSKVYGDTSDILVSPETLVGIAPAWDIREAYDEGWLLHQDKIVRADFTEAGSERLLKNIVRQFDYVFSTVPAHLLCSNVEDHSFDSEKIWSTDYIKTGGTFDAQDNLVICSGDPKDWWYRQSRIHGWENTEYPLDRKPNAPEGHLWLVEKPIKTNCTCHPEIDRLGRYGKWQKGVLSHEAFYDVARIMNAGQI